MSRIVNNGNRGPDKFRAVAVIYTLCAAVWFLGSGVNFYKGYQQFAYVYLILGLLFAAMAVMYFKKYIDKK